MHEPDAVTYLEFYIEVAQQDVNRSVVVDTFRVEDVNILTTAIKFQVLYLLTSLCTRNFS